MKLFLGGIALVLGLLSACDFKDDISMPDSVDRFEGKIKLQGNLEHTCQYDVNQDGKNELIGRYSYEKSLVQTCLVYDEINGMQEYTFGPGADHSCTICVIKDENIDETYMALVTKGGLACEVIRLNSLDEQSPVVEVWRNVTADGDVVRSYYCVDAKTDKQTVADYFKNLKMVEPESPDAFSDEALDYWLQ